MFTAVSAIASNSLQPAFVASDTPPCFINLALFSEIKPAKAMYFKDGAEKNPAVIEASYLETPRGSSICVPHAPRDLFVKPGDEEYRPFGTPPPIRVLGEKAQEEVPALRQGVTYVVGGTTVEVDYPCALINLHGSMPTVHLFDSNGVRTECLKFTDIEGSCIGLKKMWANVNPPASE